MPVHKLIVGGEQWLPFALSRLRALDKVASGIGGYATQQFDMPGGATVSVRVEPGQQFLRIDGALSYEFFTSEHIASYPLFTPGEAPGYVSGSGVRLTNGAAKPLFSHVFVSPDTPARWATQSVTSGATETKDYFRTWAAWQNAKFPEHIWWPKNSASGMVSSTNGMYSGKLNQAGWLDFHSTQGDREGLVTDKGLDVPPAYYDASGSKIGAPLLPVNVWWRRAAVQAVKDRKFFIMTDTHGQFHVYPVKRYQSAPGFQALTNFKTFVPPYPGWVTLPDTTKDNSYGQWLWTFNKDATKAVSLPFNSTVPAYYKHVDDFRVLVTQEMVDNIVGPHTALALTQPARRDTPGLVELEIVISVSGPGDMDFDVQITVLQSDYFGDSGRFYVDAGYLLKDQSKPKPGFSPQLEDTLVTAEIEVWVPGADPLLPDAVFSPYKALDVDHVTSYYVVRNLAKQTELAREMLGYDEHYKYTTQSAYMMLNTGYGGLGHYPIIDLNVGSRTQPSRNGVAGTPYGFILASQLRTLSSIVEFGDYTVKSQISVKVYNTLVKEPRLKGQITQMVPPILPVGSVPISKLGLDVYLSLSLTKIKNAPHTSISAHPDGHWSTTRAHIAYYDMIQPKGGKLVSHKDKFNKAFDQNRDYSFYNYADPIIAREIFDIGSFCTQGIWITF